MTHPMRIVVLGLSLSSSWGNGHATTYRALLRALAQRGHEVIFLERDQPWYFEHRDLVAPDFCRLEFYRDLDELNRFEASIKSSDATIVGSYVADGVAIGSWIQRLRPKVTAFYDIDTPVTLAKLKQGDFEYLSPSLIPAYDLYLSFTGGPILAELSKYGARSPRQLYCSVDVDLYRPIAAPKQFRLGYLGTYSSDRQASLERLLVDVARRAPSFRFIVAGPQYPEEYDWPENVARVSHVSPSEHLAFYASCDFILNVTRKDMVEAGFSPSVRLFEAAACACPIISDRWPGIESIFTPGQEILLAEDSENVLSIVSSLAQSDREMLGHSARARVLAEHSSRHRAAELEQAIRMAMDVATKLQPKKDPEVLLQQHESELTIST